MPIKVDLSNLSTAELENELKSRKIKEENERENKIKKAHIKIEEYLREAREALEEAKKVSREADVKFYFNPFDFSLEVAHNGKHGWEEPDWMSSSFQC